MFFKILAVVGLGSFQIHAAIPAGLAFDLSPWIIFLASVCGGLAGIYTFTFLGVKVRSYISGKYLRNRPFYSKKQGSGLVYRLWNKFGTFGLGFLGTITIGAPLSIAAGIGCKAPLKKLITWCCLGVITRSAIYTTLGWLGLQLL